MSDSEEKYKKITDENANGKTPIECGAERLNESPSHHVAPTSPGIFSEEVQNMIEEFHQQLKSQIAVMKKAYLDEQSAHNELKNSIKVKEKSLEKLEQEVDSLKLRNQELSTRCLWLQDGHDELDSVESHRKKSKNMIEELRQQVNDNAIEYRRKLNSIQETLEHYESTIDMLQEENAMLEVKLQNIEDDNLSFHNRTEIDIPGVYITVPGKGLLEPDADGNPVHYVMRSALASWLKFSKHRARSIGTDAKLSEMIVNFSRERPIEPLGVN